MAYLAACFRLTMKQDLVKLGIATLKGAFGRRCARCRGARWQPLFAADWAAAVARGGGQEIRRARFRD